MCNMYVLVSRMRHKEHYVTRGATNEGQSQEMPSLVICPDKMAAFLNINDS